MKILMVLFLAIAAFTPLLTASEIFATESVSIAKCAMPVFNQSYKNSKAIFAGKVTGVRTEGDERIFTFQVEKYWKGGKRKTIEVRYYETMRYQAWLQVNGRYLVFAYLDEKGNLSDGRCSLTKEYSQASAELKKLGKGKAVR